MPAEAAMILRLPVTTGMVRPTRVSTATADSTMQFNANNAAARDVKFEADGEIVAAMFQQLGFG